MVDAMTARAEGAGTLVATATEIDPAALVAELDEQGYARVGRVASDTALAGMRARADAIMAGEASHEGLFLQADPPTGAYEDLVFGAGWIGPTSAYRKIERLERDPVFRPWIENPTFARIARAAIDGPVALYRATLWNKRAGGGTFLPWHQDGGRFWGLDGQPTLQRWTALDDAPREAGCVEVLPGTHRWGLATPEGGTVPDALTAPRLGEVVHLPALAGEVLLIHNLTWHRSGVNHTTRPRRALSICLMSAALRCTRTRRAPRSFERLY
jgi:phytanoyl-CoA hydroxylase